jgi:hypothetical protein
MPCHLRHPGKWKDLLGHKTWQAGEILNGVVREYSMEWEIWKPWQVFYLRIHLFVSFA